MSAIFSTDAVRDELETTIQQTQTALEEFNENSGNLDLLERVQNYVRQIRGIFQVLQEEGAVKVCDEMNASLMALPHNEQDEGTSKGSEIMNSVSQALVVLNRFLELLSLQNTAIPAVLLPAINRLREARSVPSLGEGHFFDFSFKPGKPASKKPVKITRATLDELRQFRQMYQAGLLHVLRGQRSSVAFRYMSLALGRVDQALGNVPCASLWWVASAAFEALSLGSSKLTPSRKKLFSQLDRQLKAIILNAPTSFNEQPSAPLIKEFLYLIALNRSESLKARNVARFFKIPELKYSDLALDEQRQVLFSPGRGVLNSVSEALKDDINAIKEAVDEAARGGEFSAKELHGYLTKVADVYVMLGLQSPSNVLKIQAKKVAGWSDSTIPEHRELLEIADVVLYAESALSRLLQGQSQLDEDGDNKAFKSQVYDARVVLIDESESGLVLAKRAISAYVESSGDKLHLANLADTLNGVRGALIFLESLEAADIVARSIVYVETELLQQGTLVNTKQLELFADTLSSLEFYLEGLLNAHENKKILELAVQSLRQLHV